MIKLNGHRRSPDNCAEHFVPSADEHGRYVLADRAVHPWRDAAANRFLVGGLKAVAARVRKGGVSVLMRSILTGRPERIGAAEIEIVADDHGFPWDDPLAAFAEWASGADDRLHRDL